MSEPSSERQLPLNLFGWFVCGLGAIYYAYEYLLRISPGVMNAELMQAFGINAAQFGYFAAFYYYAYTLMQLPVGVLMDKFRPRLLLTLACLLCAIGTYLFAYTDMMGVAAVGRFLQGFGSAFAFVGVLALATIWLPPHYFGVIAGLTTSLGMLGAMFGDVLMAELVVRYGWQATLTVAAHAGVVLTVILWIFIRNRSSQQSEADFAKQPSPLWTELFAGAVRILKNPQIWLAGIVGALLYLSLSVFAELWGMAYLEVAHGLTKVQASKAVGAVFLGWAIGAPIAGLLSDRLRLRVTPLTIGAIVAAVCVTVLIYVPNLPVWLIFAVLFGYGVFCAVEVVVFAIGRESSSPKLAATAIAIINMLIMFGGVIFQPLVGVLLDVFWSGELVDNLRIYSMAEYQKAFSILPVSLIIAAALTYFLKETYAQVEKPRASLGL